MNFEQTKKLTALLAFCLPLVSACSVPQMRVSEGLQQEASALPVTGRSAFRASLGQEKGFGFGTYQLQGIQRGWTRSIGSGKLLPWQITQAYQPYSFSLTDMEQGQTWPVQVATILNAATVEVGGWSVNLDKQREFLKAGFESPESGVWQLSLADPGHYTERHHFVGKLWNEQEEITVQPLYRFEGKSLPSATALGYEFSRNGQVLASVQTMNNGKVWLRTSLSPDMKRVLASASAALLLYQQLGEEE